MISTHNALSPNDAGVAAQGRKAPDAKGQTGDVRSVMTKSMNAGVQRPAPGTIWHKSGEPLGAASNTASPRPDLSLVPAPRRESHDTRPAAAIGLRHGAQRLADRLIGSFSLVSTGPVLDVRAFDWTATLRRHWGSVHDEALAIVADDGETPLWHQGSGVADALPRCPETMALLHQIPGLESASFVILPAATHRPMRRGPTKALITCDLGLRVPRCGDVRMRIHDRIVRWAEGETLMFDDSFAHEAWNEANGPRLVLRIRFARPLRGPGSWLARAILHILRRRSGPEIQA